MPSACTSWGRLREADQMDLSQTRGQRHRCAGTQIACMHCSRCSQPPTLRCVCCKNLHRKWQKPKLSALTGTAGSSSRLKWQAQVPTQVLHVDAPVLGVALRLLLPWVSVVFVPL